MHAYQPNVREFYSLTEPAEGLWSKKGCTLMSVFVADLYLIIAISHLLGAILIGIYLKNHFRKSPSIHLIQGKLTNVNECPLDSNYLEITNEWEEDN